MLRLDKNLFVEPLIEIKPHNIEDITVQTGCFGPEITATVHISLDDYKRLMAYKNKAMF